MNALRSVIVTRAARILNRARIPIRILLHAKRCQLGLDLTQCAFLRRGAPETSKQKAENLATKQRQPSPNGAVGFIDWLDG